MSNNFEIPDKEKMMTLFLDLAQYDSLSFHERRVADRLKTELQALGFEVTEDDAVAHFGGESGNLYGFLKGTTNQESVLFSAHMDTVEPGLAKKPQISDERITSDGTSVLGADDLCGIVEILEGIRLARRNPEGHGDIEVLFTVGEEAYGQGSKAFDFSLIRSREAYVLDMSGAPGMAARKAPSIISFEVRIEGKAAHAGFAPQNGINAILAGTKAIAGLPQGSISEQTKLNIGTVNGGTANNIVAEHFACSGEIRSFDHREALRTSRQVEEAFGEECRKIGAALQYEQTVHIEAYETPEEAPVCQCFQRACRQLGLPGQLKATHGGSDNNIFAKKGISGIVLSCGMYRTHSTEEYTSLNDLAAGAELVAAIIGQR